MKHGALVGGATTRSMISGLVMETLSKRTLAAKFVVEYPCVSTIVCSGARSTVSGADRIGEAFPMRSPKAGPQARRVETGSPPRNPQSGKNAPAPLLDHTRPHPAWAFTQPRPSL